MSPEAAQATLAALTVLMSWCRLSLDTRNLRHHRHQDWASRFGQVRPHLLEQVPPFLGLSGRERLDQVRIGGVQLHAWKSRDAIDGGFAHEVVG